MKYYYQMLDNRQLRAVNPERRETKTQECPGFLQTPKEHRELTKLRKQRSKFEATEVAGI